MVCVLHFVVVAVYRNCCLWELRCMGVAVWERELQCVCYGVWQLLCIGIAICWMLQCVGVAVGELQCR